MVSTRRGLLIYAGALAFAPAVARAQDESSSANFDSLFADAQLDPSDAEKTQLDTEGKELAYATTKAMARRYLPSDRKISERATNLIIFFEVTNGKRYSEKCVHPVWPGGNSGVTIGIGYDLGYCDAEWLAEDWKGVLSEQDIRSLSTACGIRGPHARDATRRLSTVTVPWEAALLQFNSTTLPRFTAEVLHKLPHSSGLSDDSLGALVSLDYNRGPSFRSTGARYAEMRDIYTSMVHEEYPDIPGQIRHMTRLWRNEPYAKGLITRRNLEAALFERGLSHSAIQG